MRAFTATFWMGFKYLWRNPITVTILTVFPIVIILILGNALSSYISVDTNLNPVPAAVAADPEGAFAAFLQSDEISRFMDVSFVDETEAEQLVYNGKVNVAIFESGGELSVLLAPDDDMNSQLILSIVDSYQQIGSAGAIAAMSGRAVTEIPEVDIEDIPLGKRVPRAIDYYAVTMLVMILLYTGLNGTDLFGKNFLDETGNRVRLTPISKPALTGGLLAASTVTSYLQGLVTLAFTATIYGVYWGERIPLVLLTLFGVVLFSQSVCILMVMLLRNTGAMTGAMQGLFWTLTFVSKGYARVSFGPADKIFAYTPNSLAHTIIFGSIYGGNESKMMFDLALLFGMGAVMFILAFILGRRRLV